jgi:hypothetical protein
MVASSLFLGGCALQPPVTTPTPAQNPIRIHDGAPVAAGTRIAFQINNEPAIVQVADGRGGPPVLYHGKELNPNDLRSVRVLRGEEARERFGDQTLDAAILIELTDAATVDEGARAGIAAANDQIIVGRAVGGFAGGLPVGLFALTLVNGNPVAIVGAGVGVGIVETSWRLGATAPRLTPALLNGDQAFRHAFEKSYRERLIERRKAAARLGGVAGGVAGFGFFIWLLSSITT